MSYVKVDSALLTSSLWQDPDALKVFFTALLMAYPTEVMEPLPEIGIGTLDETGYMVQPGWYGFVEAAGPGLIHAACLDREPGMAALRRLTQPDKESRGKEYEGRRLIRVDGGFIVLNYMKYRDKDHTTAERSKRYRDRKKRESSRRGDRDATVTHRDASRENVMVTRDVTEADAEVRTDLAKNVDPDIPNSTDHANCAARVTRNAEVLPQKITWIWADRPRYSVPTWLHDEFQQGGQLTDAELREGYQRIALAYRDAAISQDPAGFWRDRVYQDGRERKLRVIR